MAKWHDECDKMEQTHENAIKALATQSKAPTLANTRSRCFRRAGGRENDAQRYFGRAGRESHQKSVQAEVIRPSAYAQKECKQGENQ